MVLIEAVRGGGALMTVEKPIIVYKEPGVLRMRFMIFTGINGIGNDGRNIIFVCHADRQPG